MKINIEERKVKVISIQLSDKDVNEFYMSKEDNYPVIQKIISLTSDQLSNINCVDELRINVWWVKDSELSKLESSDE